MKDHAARAGEPTLSTDVQRVSSTWTQPPHREPHQKTPQTPAGRPPQWRQGLTLFGLSLMLLGGSVACSSKQILEEHADLKEMALFVVTNKAPLIQLQRGLKPDIKYHLGMRLSEDFMNRAMAELLKAEIVPSTFDAPVSVTVPPFGTQVTFRPSVQAQNPHLTITGGCDECVALSLDFVGKFGVEVGNGVGAPSSTLLSGTALTGSVLINGRVIPTVTGGVPSLAVQLQPLEDKDLRMSINVPVPGLDSVVTSTMRSQIRKALTRPDLNTFALFTLKELVLPESHLAVNTLAYRVTRTPTPELQLGMTLNLTTAPEVSMLTFDQGLRRNDFGMQIGENTLTDVMRVWLAEGYLPGTFTTSGDADPKGAITVDLRSFRLLDTGYEAVTRFWYVGTPPFWREYALGGTIGVRSEAIAVNNTSAKLTGGKGPNRLIDLALLSQGVSLSKTLTEVGKKMPRSYGFPFGAPTRLEAKLSLEEMQTESHLMSTFYTVNWTPRIAAK